MSDHDTSDNSNDDGGIAAVYRVANNGEQSLPTVARFVPRYLRYDNAQVEATGLAIDNCALGPVFMASMFLGPALLQLATQAADCDYEAADKASICENKVYGFRPSSLLSNMAVISGLLVPILLPVVGAIVDHTQYRKQVGAVTGIGLALVKGLEVAIGPSTWFLITVLQVASSILYNIHLTATYAYNSELSSQPDVQARYNAFYSMLQYCSMLSFLIVVLVLSGVLGTNDVGTARISQTITSLTSLVLFSFSWRYFFRDRRATSAVRPGRSLVMSGFYKVYDSFLRIARHHKSLLWVMVSLMFAEAAMSALATIATTFATQVLKMNAKEIGFLFLIVLVAGIPGSWMAGWTTIRLESPVRSAIACNVLFIVVTAAAAFLLQGPKHKHASYLFGALWGIAMGWLSPVDTTMFISVMPKDSRAEFMGIYMLAVSILAWLPPLLFSMLNEKGINMAWGVASLDIFFVLAALCLCLVVGDYDRAVEEVKEESMEMLPAEDDNDDMAVNLAVELA